MYILDDMIDMGLKEGQPFPTDAYRYVACNIGLCNPAVTTRDILTDIVQTILSVPIDRIKTINAEELAEEFNCPGLY